jgi:Ni/Fe-hydrogenase 1 B-type cytochrome subunit
MKKWRLDFRIWHWLHALVVLGLIGTVLLRKSFLSWRENSQILMHQLSDIGVEITALQAKVIAKAIRAPMWEWHILLGYMLVALLLWRTFLFFTPSGQQNYTQFAQKTLHDKALMIGYLLIYATLAFMSLSGLIIHFYQELGLLKSTAHTIKEIHELAYTILLYFVPLHLIGITIAEHQQKKSVISDMIHGGATPKDQKS